MSVDRGLKRIRLDHDSKEVESEGDREAQQQELRNKRNKIASDILRREAMVDDPFLSRAMQLEGSIVGDVGECPKKNIPTQLLNAVLSGISVALRAGVVTVPELKQEILNFVYHYGRKMKAGLIKDDVTKSLIDDIDESLSKGIRHGSMPHACISLASSLWKISGYIGREYIRPVIEQKWNDIIDNYNQNKRAIEWANEQETEMGDMEASRLEDENRAAQVTLLTLGFEVEDNTEDAMESGNNPMQTERKENVEERRERNNRFRTMKAAERAAAAEDYDAESSDPEFFDSEESLGGKRRTRKHKKQMKHKKTKRHRKKTKKHLKKRNNKKQRKTRNRK
jgi:hypothetical protein